MIKIEMQNVCLGYSRKEVLRDVTFQVLPGEIVGLIGPNGSGKSTIIRGLTRIISLYQGRILLDGKDVVSIPRHELARMLGVVPQIPILPSAFTAFEIVLMGRNPHLGLFQYESQREMDIAWHAMERTMTRHLAKRRVGELSGGEIQCLLIARVLAQETKAVLLDEPTANLDPKNAGVVEKIIRKINNNNTTIIMSTHRFEEVISLADRIAVIHNGEILQVGTPDEIFRKPKSKQVAEFVGLENLFKGTCTVKEGISEIDISKIKIYAISKKEGKVKVIIHPEDVLVSREKIVSSARNTLKGKIVEISDKGVLVKVMVDVGIPIITLVMRRSFDDLNLNINSVAYVSFKASCVHVF